jgi:hypothetical protein
MPVVILAASFAHAQCSTGTTALATKICAPGTNTTVGSPLKFSAASSGALYAQLYVDGSKYSDYKIADVETNLALSSGSHRLTFQAFNSAGTKSSVTEYVTVKTTTASTQPTGTAVTACHQTLSANHSYYLGSDLGGSDPSAQCLTLTGPNMVLNLNGHKITGTLKVAGSMNISGVHVYNGTVHCADADPNHPGCLYINVDTDSPAITVPLEIDHISWTNTSNNSTYSERNIMVDLGGMTKTALTGPNVKIHDNTSVSATGLSNPRIANIWVQSQPHYSVGYAEFYNNATLCQSTAAACQGVVAYGLYNTKIHNNTFVNQMNQSNGDPARGALCDQTDACEIYSNTFDAQDGRAVRLRGTNNKNGPNSVHDNVVKNINQEGGYYSNIATFHLGEPDSGTEVENATVRNNTITNYIKGWVFMARGTSNITIQDNSVSAASGTSSIDLLDARSDGGATGPGPATNINLFRTTGSGASGTSNCQSGSTANVCKSGVATGSGCKVTTGC